MKRDVRVAVLTLSLVGVLPRVGVAQVVRGTVDGWTIEAEDHRWASHAGREALWLRNGAAWLDVALEDGTVAFDLFADGDLGFYGVAFRAADRDDYEHFYLRPFVSGNPDATQYTPVYHGVSGWQIYSDERFARAVEIGHGRWVHVELRVRGGRAEAVVDGQLVDVPELQRAPIAGAVALTSSGAPAWFADVTITATSPEMEPNGDVADVDDDAPPGLVRAWAVSTPFSESRLDSLAPLEPDVSEGLAWDVEGLAVRGIADLGRLRAWSPGANTVFAAVTMRAAEARPVRFRIGFSDRAHVYLNGRPLFHAADPWRARDYRFLGTVGLHYELVLPLEAGENRLWIAVAEDFGGWAVTGRLVDSEGVTVLPRH